jgi:uncharacterized protein with HEPN domain
MSKRGDKELLNDILEAIRRIDEYSKDINYDEFLMDIKTQDAVVRNLEIIGEATKNISEDIKKKYESVPWKRIAGVRDRLIHHYFGVNLDIVWGIVENELKSLNDGIEKILKNIQ